MVFTLIPLAQADWVSAADPDLQIVPGKRIGKVHLDDRREAVQAILGKPFHSRWDEHRELRTDIWRTPDKERTNGFHYLFVIYEKDRVSAIHVTSPKYQTDRRLSMESSYECVFQAYGLGKQHSYAIFSNSHLRLDYESMHDGITFTFASDETGPMVRIAVFHFNKSKLVGYSDGDDWYWDPSTN